MGGLSLLVTLFTIVMGAHCQMVPYASFMGENLANHSYVDFGQVGTTVDDSVQCHTDLSTCCGSAQGVHRGDWFFPNGTRLPFTGQVRKIRSAQRVDLLRSSGISLLSSGIYCCDIATNAVHNEADISLRDKTYVGLYSGNEGNNCLYLSMKSFLQ